MSDAARVILAVATLVWPGSALASAPEPIVRLSLPFTFRCPPGFEPIVDDLAARGPSELDRIAGALGLPLPPAVDVWLVPRRSVVVPSDWSLPGGPDWAAGIALAGRPTIVLRTAERAAAGGADVVSTFRHELVHLVTGQALGPREHELPAWLLEGSASYLAREWRLAESADAFRFAVAGRMLPLHSLRDGFPREATLARQAYLQSFAFVSWLAERAGPDSLRDLFSRVLAGEGFASAFRAVHGDSPSALEAEWTDEFLWSHRWVPLFTSGSAPWLLMTVLFLLGSLRKRRMAARRLAEMDDEDPVESPAGPDAEEPFQP